ncbi:YqeB family protein [Amycolatopsis silviterrae]|uniref:YqeB PH domain-containing protein n=1 Tax=Amycolatopsis silviterrae TaxID=1656914 RepID=A0ABW5HBH4_9PSEU
MTEIRMPFDTKAVIWVFCGAAGAGLGFAIPWLLQFAAKHPLPYADTLKFLGSFDSPLMVIGRPAALAVVGLVIAFFITYHSATLRISDESITIIEGDDSRVITREQVGGAFRHGGKVRIESPQGRVLFDDDVEGKKATIASAFRKHGYPWEGA